ncbi:MAG: hypothetical protein JSV88_20585 [Candidatus Aminicenantes bacterium]|nr:MAG: hypothetical protein JSV88_20585 [Candidatus Aminicenantes bacterium]
MKTFIVQKSELHILAINTNYLMKIREIHVIRGQKMGGSWEGVEILSDFLYNGAIKTNDER